MSIAPAPAASPFPSFTTKAERLTFFREKLATDPKWAVRALEIIYTFQTAAEKATDQTAEDNGVGFSGRGSRILSRFALQVTAWKSAPTKKFPTPLSAKQMAIVYRLIPRYAAQLIRHLEADGKLPALAGKAVAA